MTYVSLLRGINVSGRRKIRMVDLRNLYESLGLRNIRTYIQSGNVIFDCPGTDAATLARKIERALDRTYGFSVIVIMRSATELQRILDGNPFVGGRTNLAKLHVTFLSDKPGAIPTAEIDRAKAKSEKFEITGKEIYLYCPDGYGRTKLSNAFFESKLKVAATTRNWKTMNKLLEIALHVPKEMCAAEGNAVTDPPGD